MRMIVLCVLYYVLVAVDPASSHVPLPTIESPLMGQNVSVSKTINLTCIANGFNLTYLWTLPLRARSVFFTASGVNTPNLLVYPASTNTDGIYTCTVTDIDGNSVSESIKIIASNVEFISSNSSNEIIDVLQGEYEILQCVFRSPPDVIDKVIVKWVSDGIEIAPNGIISALNPLAEDHGYSTFLNITTDRGADYTVISTLHFDPVNWADFNDFSEAKFYCYGFIEGHRISQVGHNAVQLRVFYPPFVWFRPSPVNRFQVGEEIFVECGGAGYPPVRSSMNRVYSNGSVVRLYGLSGLRTSHSTFEDAGNYRCSFVNYLGNDSANFTVIVEDVPDQVLLPINVVLLSFFDARLSWEAPFNNFAETQSYIVYYHQGMLDFVNFTSSNSDAPQFVISELVPNTNYTFSVESCNPRGCGERSPEIIFPSISQEMASLHNVCIPFPLINSTSFVISWHIPSLATDPLDNTRSAVIESITITYQSNNASDKVTTIALSSEDALKLNYTVGGLESSTKYDIELIINYARPNLTGNPFHYIIETRDGNNLPADIPMVDDKSINDKDNPVIAVSWTPLTVQNGRDLLQNYIVRVIIIDLSSTANRNKRQTSSTRNFNISRNQSSFNFTEIGPFFSYTIDVLVQLIVNGESLEPIPITQPYEVTSSEAAPSAPSNFRFTIRNFTNLRVEWDLPAFPNGVIDHYIFTWYRSDSIESLTTIDINPNTEGRYHEIHSLTGYTNYTFIISAETGGGIGSSTVIHNFTLSGVAQINSPVIVDTGSINSFDVLIAKFPQEYGPTGLYKIIVVINADHTGPFPEDTLYSYTDNRWRAYGYYVAVIHDTMGNTTITIGDGGSYTVGTESYLNHPLESGNTYRVFVRVYSAYMEDADMPYRDSGFSNSFEIPQDITVFILVVLFLILSLVIIVAIIILVVVFKKKSSQGTRTDLISTALQAPTLTIQSSEVFTSTGSPTVLLCESGGTPTPELTWSKSGASLEEPDYIVLSNGSLHIANTRLSDQGHFDVKATNAKGTVEGVIRVAVLAPSPPGSDPGHPPLSVCDYIEKMALIRSSLGDVLEKEYRAIHFECNFTHYAAELPINYRKNRYVNIIPYDHSRVSISLQDNMPGSDYINASYIDGFNTPNAYIATQGPIPTAFDDFWRMIWEANVPTIVMLKCYQYWNSDVGRVASYGDVQVTLKECETFTDYAIRTFQMQKLRPRKANEVNEVRFVRQYQYLAWPDHGVPQYATPFLQFCKIIRNYHKTKEGPMVVHCSGGVGRTGTFIAIDAMIMKADTEEIIDIFNYVRRMRFGRSSMVQTADQYWFIHDAVLEAIVSRETTISSTDLVKKITALHEINPNNGLTGFQSQFETLESSSPSRDFDCSIAKIADNIKKSRRKEYFPSNDFRVALSTTDNDSDYICASYVDGYRQRKTFIATQGPLKTTVGDFWRMVWETKSSTIIMLTSLIEDGEEQSVQYWPTSSSDEGIFGKFQVELLPEECNLPDYVVRKFKLSPVNMSHEVRTVTHFHYMSWPSSSVPFTATAINNLIEDVVRVQRKSGNGPITVHCSDGLGRTGTFCAMFNVLERLKAENVIDVSSTIKSLRNQQPGLLKTLEQYQFIHQAALEFINNFENYDNFK